MSVEGARELPGYLLQADGPVVLNVAGAQARARYDAARAERDRIEHSWAGAMLAGLFLRHAWLEAVTLTFEVTSEYDDSGGFYRCIRCSVSACRAVAGQVLPPQDFPEAVFDPDAAVSTIADDLADCEFDLYAGLAGYPEGFDTLTVPLERAAIATLLGHCPFDGTLACAAWGLT